MNSFVEIEREFLHKQFSSVVSSTSTSTLSFFGRSILSLENQLQSQSLSIALDSFLVCLPVNCAHDPFAQITMVTPGHTFDLLNRGVK